MKELSHSFIFVFPRTGTSTNTFVHRADFHTKMPNVVVNKSKSIMNLIIAVCGKNRNIDSGRKMFFRIQQSQKLSFEFASLFGQVGNYQELDGSCINELLTMF